MKEQIKLVIYGRVQGVGFRYLLKQMADKFDLKGWIKNQPDGSVAALVGGDKENLKKFLNQVRQGTILAKVKEIKINKQKIIEDNFKDFEIKF